MTKNQFKITLGAGNAIACVPSHSFPAAVAVVTHVSFHLPLLHPTPREIPETAQLRLQSIVKSYSAVLRGFLLLREHGAYLFPQSLSNV